jgi:peptide/nickel transport system substrate-binding protein
MRGRAVRIIALLSLGTAALTWTPARVGAADEDRTLRIGTTQEFDSINPNLAFIGSSAEATNLDYDVLVGIGPDLEYAPTGFAEAWAQEGATWTFTIREGMRWSDGRTADASDVAFTFEYLLASMDPAYVGPWAPTGNDLPRQGATSGDGRADHPLSLYGDVVVNAAGLRSVELIDARTVALTTASPTTLLLGALVPILPEHIWTTIPFARAATDFQAAPPVVGTGPFQVVEWERGTSARFMRNPFYWGKRPYVEEVEIRFYADQDALASALRGAEIDYARDLDQVHFDAVDTDDDIVGVNGVGSGYTHLAFNTYAAEIDGGGASTGAVRDPKFRDALGYALDREAIIEAAVGGYGTPGTTALPPINVPFRSEPARPRAFDVDEARQRLTDAGYRDIDADGIREDLDGVPIDLRLFYPTSDPKYAAAAQVVTDGWERLGIGVTAKGLAPDTLAELLYVPEAGGTADYDVDLWGWTGSPDPDFLLSLLTTSQIGVWSDSNYSNPAYDELFDSQRRAPTLEERQPIIRAMLDLAYDEAPYHILFYDDELHAHRTDKLEGWTTQPRVGGVSLFTYGVQGYLDLLPAGSTASSSPTVASAGPTVSPVSSPSVGPLDAGPLRYPPGAATPMLVGILAVVAALNAALLAQRARGRSRS